MILDALFFISFILMIMILLPVLSFLIGYTFTVGKLQAIKESNTPKSK